MQSENHSFRYSLVEIAETENELNSEQAENEVVMSHYIHNYDVTQHHEFVKRLLATPAVFITIYPSFSAIFIMNQQCRMQI